MSIHKDYMRRKGCCTVRFELPACEANGAINVSLAGDFNDWNPGSAPMNKLGCGKFAITLDLPIGREYQFKYVTNSGHWKNDPHADRYQRNKIGDDRNSVVVV